jgi:hypothetical protein
MHANSVEGLARLPAAALHGGGGIHLVMAACHYCGQAPPIGHATARNLLTHPSDPSNLLPRPDALAAHLAFAVRQLELRRATPGALFVEVTRPGPLAAPGAGAALARALATLLRPGAGAAPGAWGPPREAGVKALSLIVQGTVDALHAAAGRGAAARQDPAHPDAAAAAGARMLLALAQEDARAGAGAAGLAGPLQAALHAPLLAQGRAAYRKLLADLAVAALAGAPPAAAASSPQRAPAQGIGGGGAGASGRGQSEPGDAAEAAAVELLASMAANDKDATVRAKALGALAAAPGPVLRAVAAAARRGSASGSSVGGGVARGGAAAAAPIADARISSGGGLRAALLSRLADPSKAVRRAAVQLLSALVDEAGLQPADSAAAALLADAFAPLVALADAPPASLLHDEACRAGAEVLLRALPGHAGRGTALELLLDCDSDAGCGALLGALLAGTASGGAAPRGVRGARGPGAASGEAYADWAAALAALPPPQLHRLRSLCCRQLGEHASGTVAAGAATAAGALEALRRRAIGELAASLGGLDAGSGGGGGDNEAAVAGQLPVDGPALPALTVRRLAAAARLLAVAGGVAPPQQDGASEAGGCSRSVGPAGVAAEAGNAAGEAAILADALDVLLPARAAAAAAAAAACKAGEAAAAGCASPAGAASDAAGVATCEDAALWILESAAAAAAAGKGGAPLCPRARAALRAPLLAHLPRLLCCGARCVELGLSVLATCCTAPQVQALLQQLERAACSGAGAAPALGPAVGAQQAAGSGVPKVRGVAAYLILLRHLAGQYARAEASFRRELAESRATEAPAVAPGGDGTRAARGGAAAGVADGPAATGGGGGAGAGPAAVGGYLQDDAQRRADEAAAERFVDSLLAEGGATAAQVPLLAALVPARGMPAFARVSVRRLGSLLAPGRGSATHGATCGQP